MRDPAPGPGSQGRRPLPAVLAAALVLLFVAGMVATAYLEHRAGVGELRAIESILLVTGFGWFVLLGALLTWRQPRNPMGWILVSLVLLISLAPLGPAYVDVALHEGATPSVGLAALAWVNNWYWFVLLLLMFVFVPLLFPDGRLPSRRWRPLAGVAVLSTITFCVLAALAEDVTTQGARNVLPNPVGISGLQHPEESLLGIVLGAGMIIGILGAFASLIVRLRRAHGQERLQVTWLLYATGLVVAVIVADLIVPDGWYMRVLVGLGFNALPLAITVAILRYRLYEIDRIVSRTISYGGVSVVLLATYGAGVLLLGRVLTPLAAGHDLAVAGSTLVAAALFRPVLRRVRTVVDRRFNRARYDARRVIEGFGHRLRHEVDLAAFEEELLVTVTRAVQPTGASIWLHDAGSVR